MLANYTIYENFFPEAIINSLVSIISKSKQRKLEFVLNDAASPPRALIDAKKFSEASLNLKFNYAILKRYRVRDAYRSGAYDFHTDPAKFRSIPLFLSTLRGNANLECLVPGGSMETIECKANRLILLRADLKHRVTEPIGSSGERLFFFLGWNLEL